MSSTLVPMFPILERVSSQQSKDKRNLYPNRWTNPRAYSKLHPYRGLRSTQPRGRIRAGRSLLQRWCWFELQHSRRLSADLAGCSSTGEFQQDVFLATPFFGGFGAPVLMDLELLPGLFNSRAASGWAHSSLHIPLACLESSPDSTCRRGLLLATWANTLQRQFCRSYVNSISN